MGDIMACGIYKYQNRMHQNTHLFFKQQNVHIHTMCMF